MSLPIEWWDRVAKMTRPSLVQTLVEEAELRTRRDAELGHTRADYNDLDNKVKKLESEVNQLRREYEGRVLIAATMDEATRAARAMGLTDRRTIVLTDSRQADYTLRGLRLRTPQVVLVPGWQRGYYANEVKQSLSACGVDYARCVYAPSYEIERMEQTQYGRRDFLDAPLYHTYYSKPPYSVYDVQPIVNPDNFITKKNLVKLVLDPDSQDE